MTKKIKPNLSLAQIINMSMGFMGIQMAFGLQNVLFQVSGLNGISAGQDVITGKTFQLKPENKLTVSPKTSLILELN